MVVRREPGREPASGVGQRAAPGLSRKAKLGLVGLSLGVSFLAAELAVRALPRLWATGFRATANPRLVYELEPGLNVTAVGAEISEQGLHDRVYPVKKAPGVFRIAVVGDSTAFGWRVPLDASLPKTLERRLNAARPGAFEVINFSVPGYATAQELEALREKVLPFQPDLVLLFFNGNDIGVSNQIQPAPTLLGAVVHNSYFLHLLLVRLDSWLGNDGRTRLAFPSWWMRFKARFLGMYYPHQAIYPRPGLEEVAYDDGNPPSRPERVPERYRSMVGWDGYRTALAGIRDLLAARGIPLVSAGAFNPEALRIHDELGIEDRVEDLWPQQLADDYGHPGPLVIPDDGHFDVDGHALAARRVEEFLWKRGLIPSVPGSRARE